MANNNLAFRPEFWAAEAVELMYENFIMGNLVHKDFSNMIASMGDTVNTRQPTGFYAERKQNDLDNLTTQDASSTNIAVKLNQRAYVSFLLGDKDQSLSFQDLVQIYLMEALQAQIRLIDRVIAGHSAFFLGNAVGGLDTLSGSNAYDYVVDLRRDFNDRNIPEMDRHLVLGNKSESYMLRDDRMISSDYVGEAGAAVRNAFLGRIGGFQTYRSPNIIGATNVAMKTATTTTAAVAAGSTTIPVTAVTNIAVGDYIICAGDNTPLRVTAINTLDLTVNRPTIAAIGSGAAVQAAQTCLVNQASAIPAGDDNLAATDGYPAGWQSWIVYDGAATPQVGQLAAFKTSGGTVIADEYVVVQVDTANSRMMLDRPLVAAVDDNGVIALGPQGEANFAFNPKALTLVSRPLRTPRPNTGVAAAIASAHGFSVRVTISYDPLAEAERVTIGSLFGVKVLDTNRGGVLLG